MSGGTAVALEVAATGPRQPFVVEQRGAQQSFLFFLMFLVSAGEDATRRPAHER
jgi:hypothetical protein